MARLERGVLPIVSEAEQLLVARRKSAVPQAVQDRECRDGRGSASALAAEAREFCALVRFGVVEHAARGIEEQRRLHEPAPVLHRLRLGAVPVCVEVELSGEARALL